MNGGDVPLCGEPTCEICPTLRDLDAFQQRQADDAWKAGRSVPDDTRLSGRTDG